MSSRSWAARMAVGLSAVIALAACSTSTESTTEEAAAPAGDGKAITIGVELPLSGPTAASAEHLRKGFELTAAEINEAGGVNGSPIRLDIQDDAADPTTGVALVDRFAQNGAVAIVGTYNSAVVLAQSEAIAAAKIPQLVYAISSAITEKKNPYTFQTGPTDVGLITGIVERMKSKGLSKPAILTDTTSFGASAKPVLEKYLSADGITPALNDTFAADAADLSAVLLKAKNSGADSVVAWTTGPAYATLATGAQQVGLTLPIFGNGSTAEPSVARLAGSAADVLYFQDSIDDGKPAVKETAARWAKEFPDGVPSEAYAAHDMLTAVAGALAESGPDRVKLRDALESYQSTELLTGRAGSSWAFSADNHVGLVGGNLVWLTYDGGQAVPADGS
ncbi:amino acid/amide ABC transporter substrate-binding protein, HAAT family [Frankia sp. EI5c]|uniref:ABC transporter substrate-binding protein n=1 Tax=Frankia sp. EI5c TaxID=683316 RepID=UPI0007C32B12|nr:ABC transporter substrate-binding protein [Frankia sp. EI5c]OAA25379.1 amino acid/amide ABC transporter substrate-binding protein, HAAT family [Frankia sp. EI5c]